MINLLSSSAFFIVNKKLARIIGIAPALLLSDLISKNNYFENSEWFFNTEANIEKDTTLSPYQQRSALKILRKLNIVTTKRKGVPAKQYFSINPDVLFEVLSYEENSQLVEENINNLSEENLLTINKNKEIKINSSLFKVPSVNEIEIYCKERKNDVDASSFFNFYESKGWLIGKNKMKNWKACVITWENRTKNKFVAVKKGAASKLSHQLSEYLKGKEML